MKFSPRHADDVHARHTPFSRLTTVVLPTVDGDRCCAAELVFKGVVPGERYWQNEQHPTYGMERA